MLKNLLNIVRQILVLTVLDKDNINYHFSKFLFEASYSGEMNDINRSVIIDYLSYLNKQRSSPGTRATRISDLAVFF